MAVLLSPSADEFVEWARAWSRSLHRIVYLAIEFADSSEWVLAGSPTAAHHLAAIADVEMCTAREWIRIGRRLRELPASADAFDSGELSYSKLRTLTRVATPENEAELLAIAVDVPAGELARALAAWIGGNSKPNDLEAHHQRQRAVRERVQPDGMVAVTMQLPPLVAGAWSAAITGQLMRSKRRYASADAWPTLAQQKVDALEDLLGNGVGNTVHEVVLHVRGDGCSLDDGTPIPESVVERIAPESYLRALIHEADGRPINASARRRHPTVRQKRVVRASQPRCVDCGRRELLEYDHNPPYDITRHTVVEELEVRCSPCHRKRHSALAESW